MIISPFEWLNYILRERYQPCKLCIIYTRKVLGVLYYTLRGVTQQSNYEHPTAFFYTLRGVIINYTLRGVLSEHPEWCN